MIKMTEINQIKVLLYARVSSKEQEQGYSLDAQKEYLGLADAAQSSKKQKN
ncbi:MAG: hypothetical protein GY730_06325 [bacterium]|nr:hypothetical protein [bacterium]